jgi:hypothetical protein
MSLQKARAGDVYIFLVEECLRPPSAVTARNPNTELIGHCIQTIGYVDGKLIMINQIRWEARLHCGLPEVRLGIQIIQSSSNRESRHEFRQPCFLS